MNIKFSIEMTEKNIPELMGLLAKMWDNPDPAAISVFEQKFDAKVLTVKTPQPITEPIDEPIQTNSASETLTHSVPAPSSETRVPLTAVPITKEELQLAAGTFMAKDMKNLTVLQAALLSIGATAVPSLRDDQLEPFAQKLRELGVAI